MLRSKREQTEMTIRNIERTRESIRSFCNRHQSINRMRYVRALQLVDKYTDLSDMLKEYGAWNEYCEKTGSHVEHDAYDLFA